MPLRFSIRRRFARGNIDFRFRFSMRAVRHTYIAHSSFSRCRLSLPPAADAAYRLPFTPLCRYAVEPFRCLISPIFHAFAAIAAATHFFLLLLDFSYFRRFTLPPTYFRHDAAAAAYFFRVSRRYDAFFQLLSALHHTRYMLKML